MERVQFLKMFKVWNEDSEEELFAVGNDDRLYILDGYRVWRFHSELPKWEYTEQKHPDDSYGGFWIGKEDVE